MDQVGFFVDALTLIALIAGLWFGFAEIRRGKQERRDNMALHIYDSPLFMENMGAVLDLFDLPENAPAETIYADEKLVDLAQSISTQLESWGVQVYHRRIELHTLDFMVGGTVRALWNRLRGFTYAQREKYGNNSIGEWFEWLADRLNEYPAKGKIEGAFSTFSDWKP